MRLALYRTAREQFTLRHLLGIAVLFGVFAFILDASRETLIGVAIALTVAECVTVFQNTPKIDQRYVKGAIGMGVTGGSAVMAYSLVAGGSGPMWFPALLGIGGVWLLADVYADFRRGEGVNAGQSEDLSSADVMLLSNHSHLVATALEDGPHTVEQLATECDLTESRVQEALDHMERSGVVAHNGDRYALREENVGLVAFVRNIVTGAARRLARPFF
ncbi:hypothetical protein [Halocatena pleomorpha]|uniref:Uncharacterized protein n=1 Tax=Halocatena pleomorpha TaxID=1785090 RepID=A0A3P3R4J3_9EURY|nr:hypothetical protein [Halocatena pleomorpha]RRJ28406.1 hypothetical protein EIK79_15635 [Halocatena pleomorpha]